MVSFEGAFITSDFSDLVALVEDWLGAPKVKFRIIGEELVYRDEAVKLYCHTAVGYEGPEERIVAEGTVAGDLDSAGGFLTRLADACAAHSVRCELSCYNVDDNGTPVGDGIEFYAPPRE